MDKTVRDCRTLAIEYWCRNGAIPTAEHRKTLVEFLSFVFGRHLQHVGHSFFLTDTPTTTLVQYLVWNLWCDDLRALALETSEPPIDFSRLLVEAEEEEDADSPSSKFELFDWKTFSNNTPKNSVKIIKENGIVTQKEVIGEVQNFNYVEKINFSL